MTQEEVEQLIEEMITSQRRRLSELARRIAPDLTPDDLLQPHDHPRIRADAAFQYEDGVLAGYLAILAALRAKR